jgi:hypothetical protein
VRLSARAPLTPDTGYDTHTGLNQTIQPCKPSSATSSPSAQAKAKLEGSWRIPGGRHPGKGGLVACGIFVVRSPTPRLPRGSFWPGLRGCGAWLLQAPVRAEAGGCSRPHRHGAFPGSRCRRRRRPQRRGWPAAPRDHPQLRPQPWQPRAEERCWHKAVPPRVGPCLPAWRRWLHRGGRVSSVVFLLSDTDTRRSRGRGAVLSHVATQVPDAHT